MVSAGFQTSGNVEAKREASIIDVIKGSVINRLSLRTRVGSLSIPGALHKVKWHVFSAAILTSVWISCIKMRQVWTSKLPWATKIRLFRATVESVLLYGSECGP